MDLNAWFISDLHLKDSKERNSQSLLRFFNSLLSGDRPVSHLFLLGDIFDVWIGGHSVFQSQWHEHIEVIRKLKDRGVEVVYFEGNHDVHIDRFWQRELGIPTYTSAQYFTLGPWTVRLEHGDLINLDDITYLKYRNFIRSFPLRQLAYYIPGKFWMWFGNKMSHKSREQSQVYRQEQIEEIIRLHRQHAERSYDVRPFDFIISGHLHVQDDYVLSNKKARAINLGSWLSNKAPALLLNETGAQLHFV